MVAVHEISWEEVSDPAFGQSSRQAFRAALALVAQKATEKLPACNGRVAKALALVLAGDVTLQADGTATVSSQCDPAKQYRVEHGVCECIDFAHAPHGFCKHRLSVGLYRRALELTSLKTETSMVPVAQESVPTQSNLPEAPASANCHVTVAGRQVQITLRDTDETRLLARLTTLLAQYPVEQSSSQDHTPEGWCAVNSVQMRRNEKDGRNWWSHKAEDGSWCKGKPKGQGR